MRKILLLLLLPSLLFAVGINDTMKTSGRDSATGNWSASALPTSADTAYVANVLDTGYTNFNVQKFIILAGAGQYWGAGVVDTVQTLFSQSGTLACNIGNALTLVNSGKLYFDALSGAITGGSCTINTNGAVDTITINKTISAIKCLNVNGSSLLLNGTRECALSNGGSTCFSLANNSTIINNAGNLSFYCGNNGSPVVIGTGTTWNGSGSTNWIIGYSVSNKTFTLPIIKYTGTGAHNFYVYESSGKYVAGGEIDIGNNIFAYFTSNSAGKKVQFFLGANKITCGVLYSGSNSDFAGDSCVFSAGAGELKCTGINHATYNKQVSIDTMPLHASIAGSVITGTNHIYVPGVGFDTITAAGRILSNAKAWNYNLEIKSLSAVDSLGDSLPVGNDFTLTSGVFNTKGFPVTVANDFLCTAAGAINYYPIYYNMFLSTPYNSETSTTITVSAAAAGATVIGCANTSNLITDELIAYLGNDGLYHSGKVKTITSNVNFELYSPIVSAVSAGANFSAFWFNAGHASGFGCNAIVDAWYTSVLAAIPTINSGRHGIWGDSWMQNASALPLRIQSYLTSATYDTAFGTAGYTTANLITNFNAVVVPMNLNYLWINGGLNDASGSISASKYQQNILTLIGLCQANSIVPLFLGVPPVTAQLTLLKSYADSTFYVNASTGIFIQKNSSFLRMTKNGASFSTNGIPNIPKTIFSGAATFPTSVIFPDSVSLTGAGTISGSFGFMATSKPNVSGALTFSGAANSVFADSGKIITSDIILNKTAGSNLTTSGVTKCGDITVTSGKFYFGLSATDTTYCTDIVLNNTGAGDSVILNAPVVVSGVFTCATAVKFSGADKFILDTTITTHSVTLNGDSIPSLMAKYVQFQDSGRIGTFTVPDSAVITLKAGAGLRLYPAAGSLDGSVGRLNYFLSSTPATQARLWLPGNYSGTYMYFRDIHCNTTITCPWASGCRSGGGNF